MKLDFDPNKPDNRVWASYIPHRYNAPAFKLHVKRAHAYAAMENKDGGIIFRHDGEKWIEVVRYGDGIELRGCAVEGCPAKIMPEEQVYGEERERLIELGFERGHRIWVDRDTDSPSFAVVCNEHTNVRRMKVKSPLPIKLKGAS